LATNPLHFFQLIFGINSADPELNVYIQQMNNWAFATSDPFFSNSLFIIRFHALANLFSFGFFHVNTLLFCFLVFSGFVAIYKLFYNFFISP
ncbi:MAG: hypothetical protein Q8K02_14735, partial [Flavobacterium sp.]|nr:hypothetical protein [Flavobacterium sp.]